MPVNPVAQIEGARLMLVLLAEWLTNNFYRGFNVFQYLTLRGILGILTALVDFTAGRTGADSAVEPPSDWPAHPRGRPQKPSGQGRHPDHGRGADSGRHRSSYPAMGGSAQPLCLDRVGGNAGVRRYRLDGRLQEIDPAQLQRLVGAGPSIRCNPAPG
jgi:hypothetical protein